MHSTAHAGGDRVGRHARIITGGGLSAFSANCICHILLGSVVRGISALRQKMNLLYSHKTWYEQYMCYDLLATGSPCANRRQTD